MLFRTQPRTENSIYWDGGLRKVEAWKTQHLGEPGEAALTLSSASASSHCEHNKICNLLGLRTLQLATPDDDENDIDESPKAMGKKLHIDFLVHEKNVHPS